MAEGPHLWPEAEESGKADRPAMHKAESLHNVTLKPCLNKPILLEDSKTNTMCLQLCNK